AIQYRSKHGGGFQQLLSRAIGLHKKKHLRVCDISAGLGRDAFILAALGAQVTMIERSPIIAALLEDGWLRAREVEWIRNLNWNFIQQNSFDYLEKLTPDQYPQVIYFDPMFPERKKSALVKKEMRALREIVGEDHDAPELLKLAVTKATERVVVKRPRLSEPIPGPKPSFNLAGQSSRYDIYLIPDMVS
ncbi:MAG: class I SAM-dependent methyltransferase, partial [Proteobacteria bacterium]|nr:class I SAM-dependent methyltransferase [Pseudomonadota bacterium]